MMQAKMYEKLVARLLKVIPFKFLVNLLYLAHHRSFECRKKGARRGSLFKVLRI